MGCILLINETDTSTVFRIFLITGELDFVYNLAVTENAN